MTERLLPVQITGTWYPIGSSTSVPALLRVDAQGQAAVCQLADDLVLTREAAQNLQVSARLGNTPRHIQLPDVGMFESSDHAEIDTCLQQWQPSWWRGWVHTLESHWRFVALTTVVVVFLGWSMVHYGLPAASKHVAHALPADTLDRVAGEVLVLLDRTQLQPSELEPERKAALHEAFAPMLARFPEQRLQVLFRKGGSRLGANALALPDGTIIFTDEMVALAESDDELLAVLGHEIGHIVHRHSLRAMIQNASLGAIYMLVAGDASVTSELIAGLPVLMASLSYSRHHEWEADQFSAHLLDEMGIDRAAFTALMQRVYRGQSSQRWEHYFSTHPDMARRLRAFDDH